MNHALTSNLAQFAYSRLFIHADRSSTSRGILKSNDEVYQQRRAERTRKVRGRDVPAKNNQLHMFHGAPGTGKTQAMKVLAAEGGRGDFVS